MSRIAKTLIGAVIGALAGFVLAFANGRFSHSPAQTSAGQIAYVIGLLLPTVVIGALIGFFTWGKPRQPN